SAIAQTAGYVQADSVLFGDSLEMMKLIAPASIDLIFCDLPYGTTNCKWDVIIPFDLLWFEYKRVLKPGGRVVLTAKQPFTSKLVLSNIDWFREIITCVKHKPTNFANGKYMHLNYTEDVVVFGVGKGTYNPQRVARSSERVKQAQKGNSKNWRSVARSTEEVAFGTNYEPREWTVYDADTKLPMNYLFIPAVVSNSNEKLDHPTQKPVALVKY